MITKWFLVTVTIPIFSLVVGCDKTNAPLISEIQTHILVPGESHAGLWLGPGLFCLPSERPRNFHIFFSESDRKGGDSIQKNRYFTVDSFPEKKERIADWWKQWEEHPWPEALLAKKDADGYEWVPTFNWKYHKQSGKWLGIGHLLRHKDKRLDNHVEHLAITWSVYDAASNTFTPWQSFRIQIDNAERPCVAYGQRVDLQNGDILLPFSAVRTFTGRNSLRWCGAAYCTFNGKIFKPEKVSELFTNPVPRGFGEPSMTFYNGNFYMTLRAQDGFSHVTVSNDGMDWRDPQPWSWDDGTPIAMNQTMTKFITHSDGLYLVYTRITGDNDNVFRNRAPLFIARVDAKKLCLVRESERVVFPNKGMPIGNFNIRDVSPLESWVTVPEWDRSGRDIPCNILLGRVIWNRKNKNIY